MNKKTIMIDMDEVIVKGRFTEFLSQFLDEVDFAKLNGFYRQELIKGKEEEFKKIYQFRNLYKNDDDTFIPPLPYCVETIKKLQKHYQIYILTAYIWKENIIDAATNLKNKYEYLRYFFPFIDPNNFIFITDKSQIKFDIGIDDRPKNLINCAQKILFTEFRNQNISEEDLQSNGIVRANDWQEVKKILIKK